MKWTGLLKKAKELSVSLYLIVVFTVSAGIVVHIFNASSTFSYLDNFYSRLDTFFSEEVNDFWQLLILVPLLIPIYLVIVKKIYNLVLPKVKGTTDLNQNIIERRALRVMAFGVGMFLLLNIGIFSSYSFRELVVIVTVTSLSAFIATTQLIKVRTK